MLALVFFYRAHDPSPQDTAGENIPTSVGPVSKLPHRHVQWFVSLAILGPVKLTIPVIHRRWNRLSVLEQIHFSKKEHIAKRILANDKNMGNKLLRGPREKHGVMEKNHQRNRNQTVASSCLPFPHKFSPLT